MGPVVVKIHSVLRLVWYAWTLTRMAPKILVAAREASIIIRIRKNALQVCNWRE